MGFKKKKLFHCRAAQFLHEGAIPGPRHPGSTAILVPPGSVVVLTGSHRYATVAFATEGDEAQFWNWPMLPAGRTFVDPLRLSLEV